MQPDWCEIHRPGTFSAIIGNSRAKKDMVKWAEKWSKDSQPSEKALILVGPPGVGKTTAAYSLASDMGWEVIEMNASDARNEQKVMAIAGQGSLNQTFMSSGEYRAAESGGRKLIVMDEADNLYESGEGASTETGDKGGKKAIVEVIKKTHQPIVLIVNDLYGLTKKGGAQLKKLAVTVKFTRPRPSEIATVLDRIAFEEGFDVPHELLDIIAKNAGGDVRGAVNDLQSILMGLWDPTVNREDVVVTMEDILSYYGVKDKDEHIHTRNKEGDIFSTLKTLFHAHSAYEAYSSLNNLDEDIGMLIHWIANNIPYQYKEMYDNYTASQIAAESSMYISRSRKTQNFSLMRYARYLISSGVAMSRTRHYRFERFTFPTYLKSMSKNKDVRKERSIMIRKLSRGTHMSSSKFEENMMPFLHAIIKLSDNKDALLRTLIRNERLTKQDVAYLLSSKESSPEVLRLFEKQTTADVKKDSKPEIKENEEKTKKEKTDKSHSLEEFLGN